MIKSLRVSWFRGFTEEQYFQFGGITLLSGRNGLGKTSVFDAIDWCLFGDAWRLGGEKKAERNLYFPSSDPLVEVELLLSGARRTLRRDGSGVHLDGREITDRQCAELIARDIELFQPHSRDIRQRLRRVLYLSQGDMRTLVAPGAETERDALMQALVGVPEAAAAEAGIRRLRERFDARERELSWQVRGASERLAAIDEVGEAYDAELLARAPVYLAEASRILGSGGAVSGDVGEVKAALVKVLGEAEGRQDAGNDLLEFAHLTTEFQLACESDLRALSDEIARQKTERDELARSMGELEGEIAAGRVLLEGLVRQEGEQSDELGRLQRVRRAVTAAAESRQALVDFRRESDSLSAELQALELQRASLAQLLLGVEEGLRQGLERMSQISAAEEKAARIRELDTELSEARDAAHDTKSSRELLLVNIDISVEELQAAAEARESARNTYFGAIQRLEDDASLRELVSRVLGLIDKLALRRCPICATEFANSDELRAHVPQSSVAAAPASLVETVMQAHLDASAAYEAAERKVELLRDQLASLDRQMQRYSMAIAGLHEEKIAIGSAEEADELPPREVLQSDNDALATRAAETRVVIEELTIAIQQKSARLSVLRGHAQDLELHLEGAGSEKLASDAELAKLIDHLVRLQHDTRTTIERARSEVSQLGQDAAASELRRDQLEADIDGQERLFAVRTQRLRAELDRLTSRIRDFCGEYSGDWRESVVGELHNLGARIEELRSLVHTFDALVKADRLNVLNREVAGLRIQVVRVEQSLSDCRQARTRFEEVAQAILDRSQDEAKRGFAVHDRAIQEFADVIYPHSHLNEISLQREAVFVSDRDTEAKVRADLFCSTGQSNAIALAIFLAIAAGQRSSKIRGLLLDEPIQNLDDLNFLAFITLLKRMALRVPVIMSTADSNAAEIIRRQLVSSWMRTSNDFQWFHWVGFDPKRGPVVEQRRPTRSLAA